MESPAAVAFEPKKPLEIVEVEVEGPKKGEVLIQNIAHWRLPYRCLYPVWKCPGR